MMNNRIACLLCLLFCFYAFTNQMYAQDELKNQISLNGDDLIPALFSSNSNEYNLGYRRLISDKKHLRLGLKYFYEDENQLTLGVKTGIDFRIITSSNKWKFFYGIDLGVSYSDNYQAERTYFESALIPFFRIEFSIGKHFSISTEPGLFLKLRDSTDYDGSPIDNSNEIFSSGIKDLGVINLNFSF